MELVALAQNPLPPGGAVTAVTAAPGVILRVARWQPPGGAEPCRGTVAILPGRSEYIEKYAEVVSDLLRRRFAVVVMDWRGQGGSTRLLADPRRGHVRHFADFCADLEAVIGTVLRPSCPPPFFALAHSMGGAVALEHARRHPGTFERLVLSAPMLAIRNIRSPGGARRLAALVSRLGRGGMLIPGGRRRTWITRAFEGNALTSDARRYAVFQALAEAAPHLQVGAPTIGWAHAAFRAMDGLAAPGALAGVEVPVLAVACGADRVVDTLATERLVGRLKLGWCLVVRHALHEVMMERDGFREQFWAAFDAFVPGSAPHRTPPVASPQGMADTDIRRRA